MKRTWILGAWTLLVLLVLNGLVLQKERLLAAGVELVLAMAPRDPRSLMQGDYMVVRLQIAQGPAATDAAGQDGVLVLKPDAGGVARYVRMYRGEALAEGERLLRYRWRDGLKLGAESFFFEEGQADRFARARFAVLRATPEGDAVLVELRDEAGTSLGGPLRR